MVIATLIIDCKSKIQRIKLSSHDPQILFDGYSLRSEKACYNTYFVGFNTIPANKSAGLCNFALFSFDVKKDVYKFLPKGLLHQPLLCESD